MVPPNSLLSGGAITASPNHMWNFSFQCLSPDSATMSQQLSNSYIPVALGHALSSPRSFSFLPSKHEENYFDGLCKNWCKRLATLSHKLRT
jgi:hypothetical protein